MFSLEPSGSEQHQLQMPSLLPPFPPSLLLFVFFLCLYVFNSLLFHFRPFHARILSNTNRINCTFQPSQQLLLFTQVTSESIMLAIFYIYLIVNKCHGKTRNNNVSVSIISNFHSLPVALPKAHLFQLKMFICKNKSHFYY